jgi:hypothetical protein
VNLDNFEPLDDFFRRISWHVTTGWESVFNASDERDLSFILRGGPGLSHRPGQSSLLAYAGVDAELGYSGAYNDNYYVGAGPALGLMQDINDAWRLKLTGRYLFGVASDGHDRATLVFEQSWRLSKDSAVNLGLEHIRKRDGWMTEASLWLNVYY